MKPLLYLALATALLLLGLRVGRPGTPVALADQLYRRGILNAAGRAELRRRMLRQELRAELPDPLTQQTQFWHDPSPATVLAFCAEAFEQEALYRTLPPDSLLPADAYLGGEALADSLPALVRARQRRFAALLGRFHHDTAAVQRELYRQLPPRFHLEERIRAEDALPAGGWTIFPPLAARRPASWIAERRSTLGKTRTRTARDLYVLGLLDAYAYQQVRTELEEGQLLTEAQVCRRGSELMLLAATYGPRQAAQLDWLRQLHRAGLLTDAGLRRTAARYAAFRPFDVLAYCPQARVVDLRRLPRDPRRLYPALLARLPALLPGFHPTDLRVETRRSSMSPDIWVDSVTLGFTATGRRYHTAFYHRFVRKDGTDTPARGAEVGYEFRRGVNLWLADQHSPLRLYLATTPDAQSVYGDEWLGLVALTAAQRPLWGTDGYFLTRESHDNGFNSRRIDSLIAEAGRLGLLSHLSPAQRAAGRARALSGDVTRYAELLECFPRVVFALDWESANPPRPYADFTARLAAISRGAFRPTDVQDGFGADFPSTATVPFAFRHQGRRYSTTLRVQSDWLDADVVDLINQAMRPPGSPGRFYDCLDGEGFIFLTPAQHRYLRRAQPALFSTLDTTQIDKADLPF